LVDWALRLVAAQPAVMKSAVLLSSAFTRLCRPNFVGKKFGKRQGEKSELSAHLLPARNFGSVKK
jgi:hypothetical protein